MFSFRRAYVPQCKICEAAVTDADGRDLVVAEALLQQGLRDGLVAEGWAVKAGDPKYGRHDVLMGDSLTCPSCVAAQAAALKKAASAHSAELNLPAVKEVDISGRLGRGWTLRQREGDAENKVWLVVQDGEVRGKICRYLRTTGDRGWSTGWQAYLSSPRGWRRIDATSAAKWSSNSTYLWRSRDLAAWGIATRPPHGKPNPAWATRRAPKSEE